MNRIKNTAKIVASYLGDNKVDVGDLPEMIGRIHRGIVDPVDRASIPPDLPLRRRKQVKRTVRLGGKKVE